MPGAGLLIARVLDFYEILIVVYVLMSWFIGNVRDGIVRDAYRVLATICEPYVGLFRRILPPVMVGSGGLDFSPIAAILVLSLVSGLIRPF
jgi:YggT family protein